MIRREPHTFNGKPVGMWYHFPDGKMMYLAHYAGARVKGYVQAKNAWCVDVSILREAERRGCNAVGVVHRIGKRKYFYLANRDDFWHSPHSNGGILNSMSQRILPLGKFLVNPSLDRELINSHMRIR